MKYTVVKGYLLKKINTPQNAYYYRIFLMWLWNRFFYILRGHHAIRVSYHQRRERLDTYVKRYYPGIPRGTISQAIRERKVRVNGLVKHPKVAIRKHDLITIESSVLPPVFLHPVQVTPPLIILYEDPYCVIVSKGAGVIVHENFKTTEPSVMTDLLYRGLLLLPHYLDMAANVVHRIDKYVSGNVLVCRNYQHIQLFKSVFIRRRIFKEYRVLVAGHIAKKIGKFTGPVRKDESVFPSRMIVDENYKRPAYTEYEVLEYRGDNTLCRVILHTGRTHQIRVHFSHAGHPVIGDLKYGGPDYQRKEQIDELGNPSPQRIMLHAYRLSFIHPITRKEIDCIAPLPSDFGD